MEIDLANVDDDRVTFSDFESSGGFEIVRVEKACYGCDTRWQLSAYKMPPSVVLPYVCGWRPGIKSSRCGVTEAWDET